MKFLVYLARLISIVLIILTSVEICLQVWSFIHRANQFQGESTIISDIHGQTEPNKKTIYFVGDSFTFGLGASEQAYSYPSQFCKLLQKNDPAYQCLNLGYPGTTSRDHFKIIEKLPSDSSVILRTGLNDHWLSSDLYKANFLGQTFEFRILKFAHLLYRWLLGPKKTSSQPFKANQWLQLVADKKLKIILYDYPTVFTPTTKLPSELEKIPCLGVLKRAGLTEGKGLAKRFLSSDLNHPNDLGYGVDARVLLNALCDKGLFGLNPKLKLPLLSSDENWLNLKNRYDESRKILLSETDPLKRQEILRVIFHLSYTLFMLDSGNLEILEDHRSITRILTRGYRDDVILQLLISSFRDEIRAGVDESISIDHDELKIYLSISRATTDPENHRQNFHLLSNEREFSDFSAHYESIPKGFLKDLPPLFPISLCARFRHLTGYSGKDLQIDEDWQRILGEKLDTSIFLQRIPLTCELKIRLDEQFWK